MRGGGSAFARALCAFGRVAHCKRLAHLGLTVLVWDETPVHELLAAVGAVVGGRRRSLALHNVVALPFTADDVEKAMRTRAACNPHLEVLTLRLQFYLVINNEGKAMP